MQPVIAHDQAEVEGMELGALPAMKLPVKPDQDITAVPNRSRHVHFLSLADRRRTIAPSNEPEAAGGRPTEKIIGAKYAHRPADGGAVRQPGIGADLLAADIIDILKVVKAAHLKMIEG